MNHAEGQVFSTTESVALDFTRFTLAAVVMLAHMSQPYFNSSLGYNLTYAGVLAVGCFFVLSGYTISGIHPLNGSFSGSHYLGKRFGRLLSVSVPALLITYLLDILSASHSPEYYFGFKTWQTAFEQWPLGFIANLTLYSQPYGFSIAPLSNSPFWSLGYEAGFYVIYGAILMVMAGKASIWLPVIAVLIYGPNVTLMAGIWALGVLMHHACARSTTVTAASFLWCTVLLVLIWEVAGKATHYHRPTELINALMPAIGVDNGRISPPLIIGAWLYLIGMIPLMRWAANRPNKNLRSTLIRQLPRQLGALTFPLYLIHFPVFVFMKAHDLWSDNNGWADLAVIIITFVASGVLVHTGNRLSPLFASSIAQLAKKINNHRPE